LVFLEHWGAGVFSDVEGLVERKADPDRLRNAPLGDPFFIDQQGRGRSLADAATVIGELDANDVVAGRQRLIRSYLVFVLRLVPRRIGEPGLAAPQQQRPAAIAAADRAQHAVRAALRDRHFGADRPGLVLEVRRRALRDADHSREVGELVATAREARPDG